ncbi:glycine betaine ABC transporter substrate-binding protein [Modestobacter lapidis]|nr:glycine betaine ABC transporter substrate-binding protein [Modestobacter lapidis]
MNKHLTTRGARLAAGLAAVALTATACGGDSDTDASAAGSTASEGAACESVNLGFIPSWTDGLSLAHLWDHVLQEQGIEVEMTEISDAAPLYAGLAGGDVDVYPSAWSEVTHAAYMDEYGDQIEDLGAWYDGAVLTFAVPEYTDIDSIADLAGNAEMFDGRIIGIEPGAGLTKTTKESVIPTYGLGEEYTLVESSTTAMLAELQAATEANEDIVVTLWRPFWANSEFPVKDLADPEGALGDAEGLHTLARTGFSEDCSDVAAMMENLTLTDEQYGSLENLVVNEYGEGRYGEAVDAWIEQNPDFMESLQS